MAAAPASTRSRGRRLRAVTVPELLIAPGNAGTAALGCNIDIDPEDVDGLVQLALEESVDMTIVGPEAPLDAGIVDRFEESGLKAFGPSRGAAVSSRARHSPNR